MENYRLKGWLNSVKEWVIGTSVKISVKSRLQNLPGLRMAIIRMTFHPNFFDPTCQTPDVSFIRKGQFHEILYQRMVVRSMSVIYRD